MKYRIFGLSLSLMVLLHVTACLRTSNVRHAFVEDKGVIQWQPSSAQIEEAQMAVKQYCLTHMISDMVVTTNNVEINVVFSSDKSDVSFVSNLNFSVNRLRIKYSDLKTRIGAFIEYNIGGKIRFIAVQHFPPEGTVNSDAFGHPFTVYYNYENKKVGKNTVETWDRNASDPFDKPRMIYSPGPPYYLGRSSVKE